MVASGIPRYRSTHAESIVKVAIEMMAVLQKRERNGLNATVILVTI